MNLLKKLRRIPEYLIVCIGYVVIPWLPRRAVVAASGGLGKLACRVCTRQRRVALANLDLAFGSTRSPQEKYAIVLGMYCIFARVILDVFWFGVFTRKRVAAWVRPDESFSVYVHTKPVLAATAHFGNWEVMGHAAALLGAPCMSVAASLDNALVDRLLARHRTIVGQGVTDRDGAVATLLDVLRQGSNTALLVDQNVLPREGGEFVDFFGLPVPMSRAPAILAQRTKATTLFAYCIAEDDGYYKLFTAVPHVSDSDGRRSRQLTQAIARTMEQVIRDHPEQWLWIYKRWKYVPDDRSLDEYPFYARRPFESSLQNNAETTT